MNNPNCSSNTVSVWGISDVHIDYKENLECLLALDPTTYKNDALIIAGDATDDIDRLEHLLRSLKQRFRWVGFVPGNHELWIKQKRQSTQLAEFSDSIEKFSAIQALCATLDVFMTPTKVGHGDRWLWLVPLLSWYHGPEQNKASLYAEKKCKEDRTHEMWSDFFLTQWPEWSDGSAADYFLNLNQPALDQEYDSAVLSFSHFLPLQELMLASEEERSSSTLVYKDLTPEFNFSRVAGTELIDQQLRKIKSTMHLYGHQHRNRYRTIRYVTYVSHCMGYPKERKRGLVAEHCARPKLLWDSKSGFR